MIPQIATAIPPSSGELIRARICAILQAEYPNQYTLDVTIPRITKIWEERCIDFDSEKEVPTINVNMDRGDYNGITLKKSDGLYLFNLDIYTSATTSAATGPGDQYAMAKMTRIAGIVRAILSNPIYTNTGLALVPRLTIGIPHVSRFFVANKSTVKDALSNVVGRLQYTVGAIETVEGQLAAGVPLEESKTHLKLSDDFGFYYDLTIT